VYEEQTSPVRECACGGTLRWESLRDGPAERWLGACDECGWMTTFLPDIPDCIPSNPLAAFLLGPGKAPRPQSPPWIRLFRIAGDAPWNVNWLYCPLACDGCGAQVTFQANTYPRPHVVARCLLCLACGRASVEYLRPGTPLHETPVVGEAWAPPCPAVARLREAVFRPFWANHFARDSD
jgi:hypothetical protein